jgi:lipoate-protein ligase A
MRAKDLFKAGRRRERSSAAPSRNGRRKLAPMLAMSLEFSADPALPAQVNMDRDRALLASAEAGAPAARVYSWDSAAVSLGRYQHPHRDLLNPDLIPWVMRPTGGKAVLHGHDATVAIAWPLAALADQEHPVERLRRSVRSVYRALTAPLIEALRLSGLDAALGEETRFAGRGLRTADCFAHVSSNDVVHRVTGVKVCGCALYISEQAVLLQASIPCREPLIDPSLVFSAPARLAVQRWQPEQLPEHLRNTLMKMLRRYNSGG